MFWQKKKKHIKYEQDQFFSFEYVTHFQMYIRQKKKKEERSNSRLALITLRIPPDGRRCNVRQPVYVHTTSYAARGRKRKQKSDDIVLYYLLFLSGYKGRW